MCLFLWEINVVYCNIIFVQYDLTFVNVTLKGEKILSVHIFYIVQLNAVCTSALECSYSIWRWVSVYLFIFPGFTSVNQWPYSRGLFQNNTGVRFYCNVNVFFPFCKTHLGNHDLPVRKYAEFPYEALSQGFGLSIILRYSVCFKPSSLSCLCVKPI